MKAITYYRYGPPEVLQLEDVELPTPRANEVRIKIGATAITKGDCELRSPEIPSLVWFIVRVFFGFRKPRKKILGAYLAGEVDAVGTAVQRFKKGDRIFGTTGPKFGAYAQYVCLPESEALTTLPPNLTYADAAPLALGLDGVHFLRKAKIKNGDKVLINGAGGGIGTYALQIAKYHGAEVTAVDSSDKLDMLRSIGADAVIDYTQGDFSKNGATYDIVFDVIGQVSCARNLSLLKPRGRYISANPELIHLMRGLWTSISSSKKVMTGLAGGSQEDLDFLRQLAEAGQLKTIIDSTFAPEQMVAAHHYVETETKKGNALLLFHPPASSK